jgi:hypothetical protein
VLTAEISGLVEDIYERQKKENREQQEEDPIVLLSSMRRSVYDVKGRFHNRCSQEQSRHDST